MAKTAPHNWPEPDMEPFTDEELDTLEREWAKGVTSIFAEQRLLATVRMMQRCNAEYRDALRRSGLSDGKRVTAWARDPKRKEPIHAFTSGAERQAAYWIEWAWANPPHREGKENG